jgi:hypothetical protein
MSAQIPILLIGFNRLQHLSARLDELVNSKVRIPLVFIVIEGPRVDNSFDLTAIIGDWWICRPECTRNNLGKKEINFWEKIKNYEGIHPNKLAPNVSRKAQLDISSFLPEN